MASLLHSKIPLQSSICMPIQSINCRQFKACFILSTKQSDHHTLQLSPHCSISSPTPPVSKEEAILQAKVSLYSTLEKPLNNPNTKLPGKLKKSKQLRLRIEIPVVDESASALTQLAVEVFAKMPIRKKGPSIKILLFWPDENMRKASSKAFESQSGDTVENIDFNSISDKDIRIMSSFELVVFMAPVVSKLEDTKLITDTMFPKPIVMFNPKWTFEEEAEFGELSGFVGSFEVVYSFMGLEVRGILSKRKGIVFMCVRDGIISGEKWNVFVEENEDLKLVSSFKKRPSITEVENVLYNLMAINSPITKSAKFLKDLVSNVSSKRFGAK